MIVLSYPGESYEVVLKTMAVFFGIKFAENRILLPPGVGDGYFELVNLPMNIQAMLSDFSLEDDACLVRQKSDSDFYNLRIEVFHASEATAMLINDEPIDNASPHAYIYLNSARYTLAYNAKKGLKARSLNLRFSKQAIETITGFTDENELLLNSVTNDVNTDRIIPASREMLQLLDEIMNIPEDDSGRKLKIFNRSMQLTELFFESIRALTATIPRNKPIVRKGDFQRVREVEKIITGHLDQLPPKQEELAALAHMSISKLKYIFKAVHGTSIYHYYQKARMEKALRLLQEGNTISETAEELGFRDLTNFTRNFKREYKIQPGKVRQLA